MLYALSFLLRQFWGPFRLLSSFLVLIGLGAVLAALLNWYLLPRLAWKLPRDRGKRFVPKEEAAKAKGKPTGAGLMMFLIVLVVLVLVTPFNLSMWGVILCLFLAMLTGYLDDISETPWGEYFKGALDLVLAVGTSVSICRFQEVTIWLPVFKGEFIISPWLYIAMATVILWATINTTNCSDGVDGLAGSLTLISLIFLGAFMYIVIGHVDISSYLLVPHNKDGAMWAILIMTCAGGLGGYLWHNAEPSAILMGDAGSRFLGLLVGVAVLISGNPFLVLVAAPVVLVNGGTGLVKVVLLRVFKKLGFDITSHTNLSDEEKHEVSKKQVFFVRILHKYRFPLHDHCRHKLRWSNAQVLLRFLLLQLFITPLLMGLMVKFR